MIDRRLMGTATDRRSDDDVFECSPVGNDKQSGFAGARGTAAIREVGMSEPDPSAECRSHLIGGCF